MYSLVLITIALHQTFSQRLPPFNIRDDELIAMSRKLREADENKARPGEVFLNFQGHTNTRDLQDNAVRTLFDTVQPSLIRKPSYSQFIALSDNFSPEVGITEPRVSLEEEKREISNFLNTILHSKPWMILS
ncbi:hypothetical protein KIN20_001937 [Parelaphostrongylus tenuis]|uniref:EndoU domain-containing protein n=1 Tax=Parelaphostrongylus tenuis TaxID=148309 RepID=A0AAD5QF01_PARTN|nr:hypothetical protein KIN20_001937 [Parelaphostrongylus tenuis]